MLAKPVRVANWNHLVKYTVHDERRLSNSLEFGEPLTGEVLPLAKRGYLGTRNLRS
jgi:hypothetical protein